MGALSRAEGWSRGARKAVAGGRRGLPLRSLLAATLARAVQDFVKRDALVNLTAVIPIAGV
jgi:hypothetical protein